MAQHEPFVQRAEAIGQSPRRPLHVLLPDEQLLSSRYILRRYKLRVNSDYYLTIGQRRVSGHYAEDSFYDTVDIDVFVRRHTNGAAPLFFGQRISTGNLKAEHVDIGI